MIWDIAKREYERGDKMREMMDGIGFSKEKWVKVRFFKKKIFIFAKEFIPMVKIWWSQMVIMAMQVILLKKVKIKIK